MMKSISTEVDEAVHKAFCNLAWMHRRPIKRELRIAVAQYVKAHEKELAWVKEFEEKHDDGKGT